MYKCRICSTREMITFVVRGISMLLIFFVYSIYFCNGLVKLFSLNRVKTSTATTIQQKVYHNVNMLRLRLPEDDYDSNLNSKNYKNINRIAIDYGPRVIGIALSSASPSLINNNYYNNIYDIRALRDIKNNGNLIDISNQILDIALNNQVQEILVGVPLDSDGIISHQVRNLNGRLCLNFSSVLSTIAYEEYSKKFKINIIDERYSTREAKLRIKYDNVRGSIDGVSAACLLERHMEDEGVGVLQAKKCLYPIPPDLKNFDYEVVKSHIRELRSESDDRLSQDPEAIHIKRMKEGNFRSSQRRRQKQKGQYDRKQIRKEDL